LSFLIIKIEDQNTNFRGGKAATKDKNYHYGQNGYEEDDGEDEQEGGNMHGQRMGCQPQ